jgi:hypothetical protein
MLKLVLDLTKRLVEMHSGKLLRNFRITEKQCLISPIRVKHLWLPMDDTVFWNLSIIVALYLQASPRRELLNPQFHSNHQAFLQKLCYRDLMIQSVPLEFLDQ